MFLTLSNKRIQISLINYYGPPISSYGEPANNTELHFSNGSRLLVSETPEEIDALLIESNVFIKRNSNSNFLKET